MFQFALIRKAHGVSATSMLAFVQIATPGTGTVEDLPCRRVFVPLQALAVCYHLL